MLGHHTVVPCTTSGSGLEREETKPERALPRHEVGAARGGNSTGLNREVGKVIWQLFVSRSATSVAMIALARTHLYPSEPDMGKVGFNWLGALGLGLVGLVSLFFLFLSLLRSYPGG